MSGQFNFDAPLADKAWEKSQRDELIAKYTKEELWTRYKDVIGQAPKADMADEDIASGILDPEREKMRIRTENLAEDHGETTRTYRR